MCVPAYSKTYFEDGNSGFVLNVVTWNIQGDSKVSVHGEVIQKFPYVKVSLYAELAVYGNHGCSATRISSLRSFFKQRHLGTLLKRKIKLLRMHGDLNHPVACVHEVEAAGSSVTLIPLIRTTRLHS